MSGAYFFSRPKILKRRPVPYYDVMPVEEKSVLDGSGLKVMKVGKWLGSGYWRHWVFAMPAMWAIFAISVIMLTLPIIPGEVLAWDSVCGTSSMPLRPGDSSFPEEIAALSERLMELGYQVPEMAVPPTSYDQALADVVRRFQADHGLVPDGIVGEATWQALAGEGQWIVVSTPGAAPKGKLSILVDADRLRLTLYADGVPYKSYPIAVGRPKDDLLSPVGEWKIINKGVNWGGGFGTRWMGLNVPWGIYGIHGTNKPYSIGTRASHGCIRMYNHHVEELYSWVPIGTPVTIVGPAPKISYTRTIKMGMSGRDVVYVQMKLDGAGFEVHGADGRFGPKSAAAVEALQKVYGLPVDGTVYDDVYYILGLK